VKKTMIIIGAVVLAVVLFVGSTLAFVKMRGGVGPDNVLAKLPLVGGMLLSADAAGGAADGADADAGPMGAAAGVRTGNLGFLRHGENIRIKRLLDELTRQKAELDTARKALEKKERDWQAWALQVKLERDAVRQDAEKERQELMRQSLDLAQREDALKAIRAQLDKERVAIAAAEQADLKTMSDQLSGMDAQAAANLLVELYSDPQAPERKDTVVKVMYMMEPRNAAKVFEAFPTTRKEGVDGIRLAAEIFERLKAVTQEPEGVEGE